MAWCAVCVTLCLFSGKEAKNKLPRQKVLRRGEEDHSKHSNSGKYRKFVSLEV